MELSLKPLPLPERLWSLVRIANPNEAQEKRFRSWLNLPAAETPANDNQQNSTQAK
jgi:hypothetical protein